MSLNPYFRFLGHTCFLLAWLSYDHYRPWSSFHGEALAFAGLWFLMFAFCLANTREGLATPKLTIYVATLALLPWLQFACGVSPFAGSALVVSLYLLGFSVAIWLGHSYVQPDSYRHVDLTLVFDILSLAALASAGIGLVQWLGLQEPFGMYVVQTDIGDRAMGNLGQPNQLATLTLMGIASLLWSFERKRIGVVCVLVTIGFLSMSLVLSQSRAGMISSVAVVAFLIWKNQQKVTRLKSKFILTWLALYLVAMPSLPYLQDALYLGLGRSVNPVVDNARLTIWKQILSGISHAPWFGYGWNQTPAAHAAGSISYPGLLSYTNAHSVVLDLLAWNGVVVGMVLLLVCAYWLISRAKTAISITAIYAFCALIPIVVHSLFEYPFAYAYFLLSAGLLVGMVENQKVPHRTVRSRRYLSLFFIAVFFVLGCRIVYEYLLVEEDFQVMRFENLNIGKTPPGHQPPQLYLLTQMKSMLVAGRQNSLPNMTFKELENLRLASNQFPYASLRLRYAIALGLNGRPTEASHQFAVIRGMYGDFYYQAAVISLRELQQKEYPELSEVEAR